MKKNNTMIKQRLSLATILIAFILIFTSCSDEPIDSVLAAQLNAYNASTAGATNTGGTNTGTITNSSVVGIYLLTAFNTSIPTDLNSDGTASTNQLSETNCYNNMLLTLNSNNTFVANSKGIDIVSNGTTETMSCFTDPDDTGTWSLVGNTLTLTTAATPPVVETYTVSGNTISATANNGQVVGYDTVTHSPAYLTCNITIVYTKQ